MDLKNLSENGTKALHFLPNFLWDQAEPAKIPAKTLFELLSMLHIYKNAMSHSYSTLKKKYMFMYYKIKAEPW